MQTVKAEMATKSDLKSPRADVASNMLATQRDIREPTVGLRRAVTEYHSAAVRHGVNARSPSAGWNDA